MNRAFWKEPEVCARWFVVLAVVLGWLGADVAKGVEVGRAEVLAPSGAVLRTTANVVDDLRTIEIDAGRLQLHLWDEIDATGTRRAVTAVTQDGRLRGRARAAHYRVELEGARFDPLVDGEPLLASSMRAGQDNRLFLVQTVVTPLPELQNDIRAAGAVIHRYLTQYAMLVEMSPATRASVAVMPYVRWVGPYHPGYRVEPLLGAVLAADGALDRARYSIMVTERGRATQDAVAAEIERMGGQIEIRTPQGHRLEATLTAGQLRALLDDNRVQYVDRWGGPGEPDMDIVREVGGADYVETVAGYTGAGVRGEIFDTEVLVGHQEWLTPILVHSAGTSSSILHGTSVMSNVFAQGISPLARGVLPDGEGIFFVFDEATQFGGSVTRHTMHQELLDPLGPYRALFQTSSIGNNQTIQYTTISAEMDDVLFLNQLLSTQSQSNTGNQQSRPQAWSKNMVSVGGVQHRGTAVRSDDRWNATGSIGPASDGRVKPDLTFFNDAIFSAVGTGVTAYGNFGGTSSATPQTAGFFGLLFEMWHAGEWAGHGGGATVFDSRPNMATAKAMMIHHAFRYDWTQGGTNADIDRFKQGWGTPDVAALYDRAPETRIIDETEVLAPLDTYMTTLTVAPGAPELKATLVYTDPMGTPGAAVHRINDLTLRVTSPGGDVYWGNAGLTTGNVSSALGSANTIDTVENVFVPNPQAGTWTVEVLADEVVQDSHAETPEVDADFALVLSPDGAAPLFADGFESGDTSAWDVTSP